MKSSFVTMRLCRSFFPMVSLFASGHPRSSTRLMILSVCNRSDDTARSSENGRRSLPSES